MNLKYNLLIMLAMSSLAINAQKKRQTATKPAATKKASANANAMTAKAKALFEDMLPNTQKVFIIDSTVVDNDRLMTAIPLPRAYGQFIEYDKFFGKQTGNHDYVFLNGFGNRCYYTEMGTDSISRLYMCDKLGEGWGKPQAIDAVNNHFSNISFPYMSSDGKTLYFSGVSSEEGLGHRDIYMTKYDADEGTFLQPENIGLPFNSAADDILYIEADADRLAWFASNRRQTDGKVCVYTFVPSETRQNYNADDMDDEELEDFAAIKSIRATWTTTEQRNEAMSRLERIRGKAANNGTDNRSTAFVVDDNTVYTAASQFRSETTQSMFKELTKQKSQLAQKCQQLQQLRTKYHDATATQRQQLGETIASMEKETEAIRQEVKKAEDKLRAEERRLLKK